MSAAKRRAEKYAKVLKQTEPAVSPKPEPPGPDWSFVERACTAPNGKRHEHAFRFLTDSNIYRIALAGRQSGKTWAVFVAMIDVALKKPNAQGLYLSFSAAATQRTTWQTLKRVIRAYNVDCKLVPTKGRVDFPNGSQLYFLGSTNVDYVETFRGGTLDIAVVDEAGATPSSRLRPLVDEILTYCLRVTRGPLIVIGTPPRKRVGWFAEQWFGENGWAKHTWTGADNPFVEGFEQFVADEAKRRGVTIDDPTIRRENFVEWVDDTSLAVVPNFSIEHNTHHPDPNDRQDFPDGFAIKTKGRQPIGLPIGNWFYAMGIDPGSRDRLAVQVVGWCDTSPNVYQIGEWVAPRNANHPLSVLVSHIRLYIDLYGTMPIFVDTSGKDLINTLLKDYNLYTVQAARKVDRSGQLARVNDLCALKRLKAVAGSALVEDCIKTEWEEKGGVGDVRRYSPSHHPDALDAFRYGLAQYWNLTKPEDKRSDIEKARARQQEFIRERIAQAEAERQNAPDLTADVAALLGLPA